MTFADIQYEVRNHGIVVGRIGGILLVLKEDSMSFFVLHIFQGIPSKEKDFLDFFYDENRNFLYYSNPFSLIDRWKPKYHFEPKLIDLVYHHNNNSRPTADKVSYREILALLSEIKKEMMDESVLSDVFQKERIRNLFHPRPSIYFKELFSEGKKGLRIDQKYTRPRIEVSREDHYFLNAFYEDGEYLLSIVLDFDYKPVLYRTYQNGHLIDEKERASVI